mgnify:CR=1 FL=1
MIHKKLQIYTDGSSLVNPGPGGYAAQIKQGESFIKYEISQGYEYTTNNRMEWMGAIRALEFAANEWSFGGEVEVFTDSK